MVPLRVTLKTPTPKLREIIQFGGKYHHFRGSSRRFKFRGLIRLFFSYYIDPSTDNLSSCFIGAEGGMSMYENFGIILLTKGRDARDATGTGNE